ncbi:MAG TPA: minichromosome maintenance protein MCM [archaeon]|nr:minichromosome maintenance protein MCM [archaeon]
MTKAEVVGPEEIFQNFLKFGEKYRKKIAQLAVTGSRSLVINFEDLLTFDSALAKSIIESPEEYLEYTKKAAWSQLKIEDPEYADEVKDLNVRFQALPEKTSLRKVGSEHMSRLIMVDGILVRATTVKPLLTEAVFKCRKCETIQQIKQIGVFLKSPALCTEPSCVGKSSFEFLPEQSSFINLQEIRIQERPEDLPPGQLPRSIDIKLLDDLVDIARPGDRVSVTGIVRAQQEVIMGKGRLRTFELYLDGNYVDTLSKEAEIVQISPEDEKQIIDLAKDPFIHMKITRSIAPSIYGYEDVKEAIMYLILGGVPKTLPDGITIRGDINLLLIGDPGVAKSQLLQYVPKISPRGLYTSGRGTTAAGLTAAVLRERTGGLVLEAGAVVLADKGVCSIDEFDKMKPEDRVAIHEMMEQQTVSVAKGGIVATLNARAAILAAANPALGRYDPYRTMAENINLPITVLSRFDLIFVLRDEPEAELDAKMSEHILSLHRTGVAPVEPPISPQLLRKYVSYAKRIQPKITDEASKRFEEFYLKMRITSSESKESPIGITPRQLESLVRLSEARARAALRSEVTAEDSEAVIRLVTKSLSQVGIDVKTGEFDIDLIMTGKPKSLRDKLQIVLSTIVEMEKAKGLVPLVDLFDTLYKDHKIERDEADKLVTQLSKEGTIYAPKDGFVKKT